MKLELERLFRLRGELAWVLIGHGAAFVGGMLGLKLLTGLLATAEYGQLALGLTIAGFLTTFLHNPLSNSAARFYAPYRDAGKQRIYFAALRSLHLQLFLTLLPFIVLIPVLVGFLFNGQWGYLVLVGLLFGIANGTWVSFLAWQNAARDRRGATLGQIADVWLRIGIAILLAMLLRSGTGSLVGYVAGTLLVLLWQNRLATRQEGLLATSEKKPELLQLTSARQEFIHFAVPFSGYAVFTSITLYADRWIVQGIQGPEAVGTYAAMYQLAASPINILFAVVNQLMVPIVYERAGRAASGGANNEIRRLLHRIVAISTAILICLIIPLWLWCEPVAALFTTPEFAAHARLIPLLMLGMAFFQLGQIYTLEGNCANRPGIYLWAKLTHAAMLCLAGVLLTRSSGVYGMAMATLVSSVVYLVSVPFINSRTVY